MSGAKVEKTKLSSREREKLLKTLAARFEKNMKRHKGVDWAEVQARLETNVEKLATAMGIEMLTEGEYRELQKLGEFDRKTSSWVKTPEDIRKLGGALFCDRRYGRVFVYHNGAESYFGSRGFRGLVRV